MKITSRKLRGFKESGKKITCLTAYDYSTAKSCDEAGVDFILVGDSLANVVLGYDSTVQIGMDEMKIFTSAVKRGVKNAMVVADMPFMSYQTDLKSAVKNAGELIRAGADAVKIEGGAPFIIEIVERLVQSGIAVVGHLGFTPQSISGLGGHVVVGKKFDATLELLTYAQALEKAGACAVVFEMVPFESAEFITQNISIPTIGIGAGAACDGQILVSNDVLGKYQDFCPKFARRYADIGEITRKAFEEYVKDVREGKFPSTDESFYLQDEEREKLENYKQTLGIKGNIKE